MSRRLDDLNPWFKPLAIELLARCVEAGIGVIIVDTLRTPEEHAENLRRGVSWTKHSKHLDGLAIDIAPYEQYALHGPDKIRWDEKDPVWLRIGLIGEQLGLRWGGRWGPPHGKKQPRVKADLGHLEYIKPVDREEP